MADPLVCFDCGARDGAWAATSGVEAQLRLLADGAWQVVSREPFCELRCAHCHALGPVTAGTVRTLGEALAAGASAGQVRLVAGCQLDGE